MRRARLKTRGPAGYFFLPPAGPLTGVGLALEPPPGLLVVPVCFGGGPLGVFAMYALSLV